MRNVLRLAVAVVAAGAAFTTTPASAIVNQSCLPNQEQFFCSYCAYENGDTGHHPDKCRYNEPGYNGELCVYWTGWCQIHA